MAALYWGLKLNSVMETSSKRMSKSFARSIKSRRIKFETCWRWVINCEALNFATTLFKTSWQIDGRTRWSQSRPNVWYNFGNLLWSGRARTRTAKNDEKFELNFVKRTKSTDQLWSFEDLKKKKKQRWRKISKKIDELYLCYPLVISSLLVEHEYHRWSDIETRGLWEKTMIERFVFLLLLSFVRLTENVNLRHELYFDQHHRYDWKWWHDDHLRLEKAKSKR